MDQAVETPVDFDRRSHWPLDREIDALQARLEQLSGKPWYCGDGLSGRIIAFPGFA